jgi:hypothetical protein
LISKKNGEDMGGYGSGRNFGASCTGENRSIDARQWQREGLFVDGSSFNSTWSRAGKDNGNIGVKTGNGQAMLSYSCQKNGGEWERLDYPIRLDTTSCHYGGVRYWFTCPAIGCGRRAALLYLGDKYFACRHCYKLAYSSQRETTDDRAIRRADKIRGKLEWQPGILNGNGWKPKGMHWKTYRRLTAEHDDYAHQALLGMYAKLEIMANRVSALCSRK